MSSIFKTSLIVLALFFTACDASYSEASYSPQASTNGATDTYAKDIVEESMDMGITTAAPTSEFGRQNTLLQDDNGQSSASENDYDQQPTTEQEASPTSPKIIYTANVRMQVDSLSNSLEYIRQMVAANGGYISDQNSANTHRERSAQLVIRLPTGQLEGSLRSLRGLAKFVDHERLNSEDVTDQWVDLEARLQTKRDVRDRYIEILRRRAVKVEDILNAEERIRRITEEIEAQEGRLRYLKNRVSLSTLNLNLYETIEYVSVPAETRYGFGNRLSSAFGSGWIAVGELLLGLVSIWPALLIFLPLGIWGWRRLKR